MIERNWDAAKVADEMAEVSVAAQQLSIRLSRIILKATDQVRWKVERIDRDRRLDIDEALEDFSKAATRISEQLLDELEYPNGGSHRQPGYRHGDAA